MREPFVDRVNYFIDVLTKNIPEANDGLRLLFSAKPILGYGLSFKWAKDEFKGNWYSCNELKDEIGWLCPALFKYFEVATKELYAKAEPIDKSEAWQIHA